MSADRKDVPKGSSGRPLSLLDLPFTVPEDGCYWITYGASEPMQLPWSPNGSVIDVERTVPATVRAAEAEALVARLREALRKHGEHMSSCASWDEADLMSACTCGLDAALAAWTEPT